MLEQMKAWALHQVGGSDACAELLEVDIQRGESHDMTKDDCIYSSLLQAALEGKVNGVIGGPNCRNKERASSSTTASG